MNHTIELSIWLRLMRITRKIQHNETAFLAQHNLTLPQFDVLAQLTQIEGCTQQDLADRLMVTKGGICTLLDRLTALGLVERRPDPKSRRNNLVYLTEAGRARIAEVLPLHDQLIEAQIGSLGEGSVHELLPLLRRLDRGIS
jgi:DNA-binding MarR family transcriptional regulator